VGVDIGGSGSMLFRGFHNHEVLKGQKPLFGRSLGVVLKDNREEEEKFFDDKIHHTVIQANVFGRSPLKIEQMDTAGEQIKTILPGIKAVSDWVGERGADLIFRKMHDGINYKSTDPKFLYLVFNQDYKLLAQGGTVFTHSPKFHYHFEPDHRRILGEKHRAEANRWFDEMQKFSSIMPVRYYYDPNQDRFVISLRKMPGAPKNLPTLEELEKGTA
jgi:hypothetical protein